MNRACVMSEVELKDNNQFIQSIDLAQLVDFQLKVNSRKERCTICIIHVLS